MNQLACLAILWSCMTQPSLTIINCIYQKKVTGKCVICYKSQPNLLGTCSPLNEQYKFCRRVALPFRCNTCQEGYYSDSQLCKKLDEEKRIDNCWTHGYNFVKKIIVCQECMHGIPSAPSREACLPWSSLPLPWKPYVENCLIGIWVTKANEIVYSCLVCKEGFANLAR